MCNSFPVGLETERAPAPETKPPTPPLNTTITNIVNEVFSGGVGGFVSGAGARSVSNPTGNELHIDAVYPTTPLATRVIAVTSGTTYTINLDVTAFSTVSGNFRCRIIGGTIYTFTSTGPNHTNHFLQLVVLLLPSK